MIQLTNYMKGCNMSFYYSWELDSVDRESIFDTPETQEDFYEFKEEDLFADEEPFTSLEENPDLEDWLMGQV